MLLFFPKKDFIMILNMTSGHPLRLILLFSLPIFIGNLFQQLYMISDMIIVGRYLGVHSLAALGAVIPIFMLMIFLAFGYTNGLSIIVAQQFGADCKSGVRRSFATGIVLSLCFAILTTGLFIPALPFILTYMNIPPEIMPQAESFISILAYGSFAMVFYNFFSNVLRALGDSKTALYFLVFSCVFNLFLNVLFIVFMGLGVAGSAWGSVCAQLISVLLCLGYIIAKYPLLRTKRTDFKFSASWAWVHLRLAIPMALQFSVIGLGVLIIQVVCNSFGTDTIAAMAASVRIEHLATLPLMTLGAGIVTFAAQNFGAGKIRRIRTAVTQSSLFSLSVSLVTAAVVYFYGENFIVAFLDKPDERVIALAHEYLTISTLFYFFLGQIFIFRQTLQGVGQSVIPLISGIVELLMRAFAALFLAQKFGFTGLCYASPIAWASGALVVSAGYVWFLLYRPTSFLTRKRPKITHCS